MDEQTSLKISHDVAQSLQRKIEGIPFLIVLVDHV
jgi:hypothetical protein